MKIISQVDGDLDVKRFYLTGFVAKTTCPRCGETVRQDFTGDCLYYPAAGKLEKPERICFVHEHDDGSGVSWSEKVQLDIVITSLGDEQTIEDEWGADSDE